MNKLSPQRRKVVALCAASAAMSGVAPSLAHGHPRVELAITIGVLLLIVYAMTQFVKLKRSEG